MLFLKITAPNGTSKTVKLDRNTRIEVERGMRYEVIDATSGVPPEDVQIKRVGNNLVFESASQGASIEVQNYYVDTPSVPGGSGTALADASISPGSDPLAVGAPTSGGSAGNRAKTSEK